LGVQELYHFLFLYPICGAFGERNMRAFESLENSLLCFEGQILSKLFFVTEGGESTIDRNNLHARIHVTNPTY